MSTNKTALLIALSLASAASTSAMAADGKINFTGKITDAPCTVSIPSQNRDVTLGNVPSSQMATAGAKSESKQFQVDLLNCSATVKSASITFGGSVATPSGAGVADPTLFAVNSPDGSATGTTASNVGIEISDSAGAMLSPNKASAAMTLTPKAASQSLYFNARYKSLGTATTGDANATTDFTIAYQ
ncbi:fimbrial protein [Hafnia alvei]|uniref:Major type 1 subunit fimbrin (Pilin) n=1 Tax=Hafnia alvei TaxID=569 RepID=A0A1C6YWA4_HAFAL|nr:fimbrial protein [Hafnia alvei]NLS56143.1 fimbrial protein [Hafnia alvei]SCM51079.1 major type 1 subunit fimbrin (pilin) [Hafnia alvei]